MDTPGVYNTIIERPTLNALIVVTSTYHLALKFPMLVGVRVVCGSQVKARHYYAFTLKEQLNVRQKANTMESTAYVNLPVVKNSESSLPSISTPTSSPNLEGSTPSRSSSTLARVDPTEQHT